MNDLMPRVEAIFRDVLDDADLEITPDSSPSNLEGWDSLASINLITSIEQEFAIRITVTELSNANSVGDILRLVDRKLGSATAKI
jgi:acyl carrier protein